jgi:Tfp pilus assembly protein PilX
MFKKKGSILPVTVVAMLIMTIIGLICIQMFMLQNMMNTVDQARTRTFYAAEGAIEMLRGYINLNYPETNNAFSSLAMPWQPINVY